MDSLHPSPPPLNATTAHAVASRATFAMLPLELVDCIVGWAIAGEHLPIRRTTHLSRYALVHSCFLAASQRRLFRQPVVECRAQAVALTRVLKKQRLAGYVRELCAVGEHRGEPGLMDELAEVGRVCQRLTILHLSEVAFHTSQHSDLIARLTRLDLSNVTLSLTPSISEFPSLLTLNCNNAAITHCSASPCFPALQHLDYSNTLPTLLTFSSSPLFFSSASVISTGPHLKHLTVSRLYSPLHYLTARKSPALIAGPLPPSPPTALTLAAETDPSLACFHSLTSLALLADSSHQAGAYFPLLDSLPLPPKKQLSTFEVLVDLGHRDRVQEVEGVAEELMRRFFPTVKQAEEDAWRRESLIATHSQDGKTDEVAKEAGLELLLLPRVFEQLGWVQPMKDLMEKAEAEGVQVAFVR